MLACQNKLILTGDAVSVISKLAYVAYKEFFIRDENFFCLFPFSPKLPNQFLPQSQLNKIPLNEFASLASVP